MDQRPVTTAPATAPDVEHAATSDVGLRRSNNQDSFVVFLASNEQSRRTRGHLFIVADGMGAHAAGELASKLAVDSIPHTYHKLRDKPAPVALKRAIAEANHIIFNRGQANPDFQGMGTTTTALLLLPSGAIVAHVGDSRAYQLRGRDLHQLSFDHSLVWELAAAGQSSQLAGSIPKNIITRSLGPNPEVEIDLEGPFPVAEGDVFLLCSDGLSGEVKDEEIGIVLQCLPPQEAVQLLIDLANLRGGPDNITVIVVKALANLSENGDDPFPVASDNSGTHPAVWGALGGSLAVAATMLFFNQPLLATIFAVVGLVASLICHLRLSPARDSVPRGQLGSGPHKSWRCPPSLEFVQELVRILAQLRNAATEEDWSIDWSEIDRFTRGGEAASGKKDYAEAISQFGRAVSLLMRELRRQGGASIR